MEYIATKTKTLELMKKYGAYFKKGLGQNFLIDKNIIEKIIEESNITKDDTVIEIGPGLGNLTQYLASAAGKVIAIEIDKVLYNILKEDTLKDFGNVEVINSDILKLDLGELLEPMGKVKVVSNLPYYITTPIIFELLKYKEKIDSITIMIQKEVAERIKAKEKTKDYGALSIAVQVYSDTTYVTTVSKGCFVPEPNVDSAVIKLDILDAPRVDIENIDLYFKIVRVSFSQRRKTLVNTIYNNTTWFKGKSDIEDILEALGFKKTIRGDEMSISMFLEFAKEVEKYIKG